MFVGAPVVVANVQIFEADFICWARGDKGSSHMSSRSLCFSVRVGVVLLCWETGPQNELSENNRTSSDTFDAT